MFNQIVHNDFMKALTDLAFFLDLDQFEKISLKLNSNQNEASHNWQWFVTLCLAVQTTDSLFKRENFPETFVDEKDTDANPGLVSYSFDRYYITLPKGTSAGHPTLYIQILDS